MQPGIGNVFISLFGAFYAALIHRTLKGWTAELTIVYNKAGKKLSLSRLAWGGIKGVHLDTSRSGTLHYTWHVMMRPQVTFSFLLFPFLSL